MIEQVVERWHHFIAGNSPEGLDALLADDVVFYSPIVYTPQRGKDVTTMYLTAAAQTLLGAGADRPFHYTKQVLADNVAVSRPAVSHHVRVLKEAGLVREDQGLLIATTDVLPAIRVYFDRLWFEASVGEGWMRERFAVSRRMHWRGVEIGGPAESPTNLSKSA